MTFTPPEIKKIIKELGEKLDPDNIIPKSAGVKGDYIKGWHAIAEANRIFGFLGWSYEILKLEQREKAYQNKKSNWVVSYICQVRVTVDGVTREDVGYGDGASFQVGASHESGSKEAVTDALKRALRTFGNQFGLALYDDSRKNVGKADQEPDKKADQEPDNNENPDNNAPPFDDDPYDPYDPNDITNEAPSVIWDRCVVGVNIALKANEELVIKDGLSHEDMLDGKRKIYSTFWDGLANYQMQTFEYQKLLVHIIHPQEENK